MRVFDMAEVFLNRFMGRRKESVEVSNEPTIRPYSPVDFSKIADIEQSSFKSPWATKELLMLIRDKKSLCFVAEFGEELAGFVIVIINPKHFQLVDIAVDRDFRGCGVGRRLIEYVSKRLTGGKRDRIVAQVRDRDLPAHMFLSRVGFRAVKVIRGHFWNSADDCYRFERAFKSASTKPVNRITQHLEIGDERST